MTFKVGDLVALGSFDMLWRGVVRTVNGDRITVFWLNDGSTHTVADLHLRFLKEVQGDNKTSKGPFAP